ncbi:hypothetical protein [Trinickia diaoshuihuensis]|jgi:hypothetical protein|uniref:hypothetical protein n=1 Tax=Trinickia diaoshuihuensis TaxID=2292265 RepID=UPI000E23DF5D|nr:hypothetical protein [Trinickia diaoshuihuensis]
MATKLDDVIAAMPPARREEIERRVQELVSSMEWRRATEKSQAELAQALGVGRDDILRPRTM